MVPTDIRQFEEDRLYMSRPSAESNDAWEALGGRECNYGHEMDLLNLT
jgi:hypothetical protein